MADPIDTWDKAVAFAEDADAMICAAKGYPLVVTMAETFSVERRRLMRFLGAKVVITPAAERAVGMINKTIELAKTHGWWMSRQF